MGLGQVKSGLDTLGLVTLGYYRLGDVSSG